MLNESNHRFPKRLRILKPAEFERVMSVRTAAVDGMIRVLGAPNDLGHPRLGLTISRKVGNAVLRNRWRRLLREAFRLIQYELPPLDLVCIPNNKNPPELRPLMESLSRLTNKIQKRLAQSSSPPVPAPNRDSQP